MKTIEYMRRKNLGHYEHEELKVSDVVKDGEDIDFKIVELKKLVLAHLGLSEVEKDNSQQELPIKEEIKEEVKEEIKEEVKEEVKEETQKKRAKGKAETKLVKPNNKNTKYDRELKTHKVLIGQFLDKKYPKWRSSDIINKASQASKALIGFDFLDENGDILDSFIEEFCKLMDA